MGCFDTFILEKDINFIDPISKNKKIFIKRGRYQTKDLLSDLTIYTISDNGEIKEKIMEYIPIQEEDRKYKWELVRPFFKEWKKLENFTGCIHLYPESWRVRGKEYILFVEKGNIFKVI